MGTFPIHSILLYICLTFAIIAPIMGQEHLDKPKSQKFWIDIGISTGLVMLAGLMSGLTMGLMSLDTLNLNIIKNSGSEKDSWCASKILPLVEKHHLLLVTLLLTNALAAEALPIFLDRLVHPAVAVAMSVTLVLLFGEVIPQAVCTRYGLRVGAYMSWFVWILIGLLFVVAWPIAKLLDAILGKEHGTFFRRTELKELVHLHGDIEGAHSGLEHLSGDEVRIIKGAIDMVEKTVAECLTPTDEVFAISIDTKLDREMLQKIVEAGHYRIPIYHTARDHFIGMILTKDLILLDPNHATPVRNLKLWKVPIVPADMPLYDMLHQFQSGRSHMAIVLDPADHITPIGLITLEDVVEELLQEEILDENDYRKNQEKTELAHDVKLARAFHRRYSVAPGAPGSPSDMMRRPSVGGRRPSVLPENLRRPSIAPVDGYVRPPVEGARRMGVYSPNYSINGQSERRNRQPGGVTFDKAAIEKDRSDRRGGIPPPLTTPILPTTTATTQQAHVHPFNPTLVSAPPTAMYTSPALANEKTPILKKSGGAGV